MTTFMLSVGEAWPRVGNTVTFLLSVGVSDSVPDWERFGAGLVPRCSLGFAPRWPGGPAGGNRHFWPKIFYSVVIH